MAVLLFLVLVASLQIHAVVNAAPAEGTGAGVDMKAMAIECNESYPISQEYLKSLNETGSFPEETEKTPKCFVRCMLMKSGMMDETGNFDATRMKVGYKDGRYAESDTLIDNCIAEDTETECMCNKAYLFAKCLMTQHERKFERLEEGEDDSDGGTIREMMTSFFREAGGVVMTVLTILSQFREIIASALNS